MPQEVFSTSGHQTVLVFIFYRQDTDNNNTNAVDPTQHSYIPQQGHLRYTQTNQFHLT